MCKRQGVPGVEIESTANADHRRGCERVSSSGIHFEDIQIVPVGFENDGAEWNVASHGYHSLHSDDGTIFQMLGCATEDRHREDDHDQACI